MGKSTLLNSLLGFKSHVESSKVTKKPGETKSLKFYSMGLKRDFELNISTPALVVVDMPGYGFAFMNERDIDRCNELMMQYLCQRPQLKRVILVLDARHGIKIGDMNFFKALAEASKGFEKEKGGMQWKLQIVFTKCDLVERMELARRLQIMNTSWSEVLPGFVSSLPILAVSGKDRNGVLELQKELAAVVPPKEEDPKKIAKYERHLALKREEAVDSQAIKSVQNKAVEKEAKAPVKKKEPTETVTNSVSNVLDESEESREFSGAFVKKEGKVSSSSLLKSRQPSEKNSTPEDSSLHRREGRQSTPRKEYSRDPSSRERRDSSGKQYQSEWKRSTNRTDRQRGSSSQRSDGKQYSERKDRPARSVASDSRGGAGGKQSVDKRRASGSTARSTFSSGFKGSKTSSKRNGGGRMVATDRSKRSPIRKKKRG